MKRLSAVLSTVIILVLLTVYPVSANGDYSVVEADFSVPAEFTVVYGDDFPPNEVFRFVSEDNSIELSCYYMENTEGVSFSFMNISNAADYFFDNISNIDADAYTFESVQTYHSGRSSNGIMIEGFIEKAEKNLPVYAYVFSTTDNIYGFEFTVYNDSGILFIDEVIDSVYITDFALYSGDEVDYDEYDGFLVGLTPLITPVIIGIISIIIKSKSKKPEQKKTEKAPYPTNQQPSYKATAEKPLSKKYELNGKNINNFNERIVVGKSDDNFAQKELERERKEREKMFQ